MTVAFYSGAFDGGAFDFSTGGSKTFTFNVAETEAISNALRRLKSYSLSIAETTSIAAGFSTRRYDLAHLAMSPIAQAVGYTGMLGVSRTATSTPVATRIGSGTLSASGTTTQTLGSSTYTSGVYYIFCLASSTSAAAVSTVTSVTGGGVTWAVDTNVQGSTASMVAHGYCSSTTTGSLSVVAGIAFAGTLLYVLDSVSNVDASILGGLASITKAVYAMGSGTALITGNAKPRYVNDAVWSAMFVDGAQTSVSTTSGWASLGSTAITAPAYITQFNTSYQSSVTFTTAGASTFVTEYLLEFVNGGADGNLPTYKFVTFSSSESLASTAAIKRNRGYALTDSETIADTFAAGRLRSAPFTLSEIESITDSFTRQRGYSTSILETNTDILNLVRSRRVAASMVESIVLTVVGLGPPIKSFNWLIAQTEALIIAESTKRGVSFNQAETDALVVATLGRARQIQAAQAESIVYSPKIGRTRPESFPITETEAMSSTYVRNRSNPYAITETEVLSSSTVRARTASFSDSQVIADTIAAVRNRASAFQLAESEATTSAIKRTRNVVMSLAEAESITDSLIRSRPLTGTLLESIIWNITGLGVPYKSMVFSLAETEAVVSAVIRSRKLVYTQTEIEALSVVAFGRIKQIGWNSSADIYPPTATNPNLLNTPDAIGSWTSVGTVTANAVANPLNGTVNAVRLDETGSGFTAQQSVSVTNALPYTMSGYFKAIGTASITFTLLAVGNAVFNLNTGVVTSVSASCTANIASVGGGWYRCDFTATPFSTGNYTFRYTDATGFLSYYMFGPKVEQSATVSPYYGSTGPNNGEYTTIGGSLSRNRGVQFPLAETESISTLIGKLKTVALALAETYGYTFNITKVKLLIASVSELETHSFGAIRRTRNVVEAINEVITYASGIVKTCSLPFSIQESEVLTEALNRVKKVQAALAEQETVSLSLARQKSIQLTIAELEALAVNIVKLKILSYVITETESVSNMFVNRARRVNTTLASVESITESFNRARAYVLPIGETESFTLNFGRLRKQLVNIVESQGTTAALSRIRTVLQSIANVTGYTFNLTSGVWGSLPGNYVLTVTWTSWEATAGASNTAVLKMIDNTEVFSLKSKYSADLPLVTSQSGSVTFDPSQYADLSLLTSQSTTVVVPDNTL